MPDVPTTNYGLIKPDPASAMSNTTLYLNNNWDKITALPGSTVITGALPQTGAFNIGSRVFRTNDNSSYILVSKDAFWGWFWRPIQAAISPWFPVPATAIILAPWSATIEAGNPFAIALDNKGNCHWRGALGVTSGNIPNNALTNVLAQVPVGIRPRENAIYQLGFFDFGAAAGDIMEYRIFISSGGVTSVRGQTIFGTLATVTKMHFTGKVRYAIGNALYAGA